ncbi:zinc finger protein 436-like [Ornithodoros turicata]|uniref:zinc finger protein 436-like n=1 Tax=Ornithodoros turicata TaxID=34597 RepID=UPI0031389E5D
MQNNPDELKSKRDKYPLRHLLLQLTADAAGRQNLCLEHKISGCLQLPLRRSESGDVAKSAGHVAPESEFSRSSYLLSHKRTHTGERPHKCDLCAAEFSCRVLLTHHRWTHTGEKPYKCNLCPAEFSQGTRLLYHKRKHMGEKPYKCDLCTAEFTQRSDLSRHKRRHTEFIESTKLRYHKRKPMRDGP